MIVPHFSIVQSVLAVLNTELQLKLIENLRLVALVLEVDVLHAKIRPDFTALDVIIGFMVLECR